MNYLKAHGVKPPVPPVTNVGSPLINNPAGVSIGLGKHPLRQEDLHIPESKKRRSVATGASQSPATTADPATVPSLTQTPAPIGTPNSYPNSTPAPGKRPSTGSPAGSQMPPNKVQVGPTGPVPARDRVQDEALAKRRMKEQAEELERQEARKNPLEFAESAIYKAVVGSKKPEQAAAVTSQPAYMGKGLADQVKKVDVDAVSKATNGPATPSTLTREKSTLGQQKVQLPSPPWSGTMTPRQLSETFANTTDIEFVLKATFPNADSNNGSEDLNGFSSSNVVENDQETEKLASEDFSDFDFLSPLVGDSGWGEDAYSWTKNVPISWNGDMTNSIEQSNNVGVLV